jgi:hypothetical protein
MAVRNVTFIYVKIVVVLIYSIDESRIDAESGENQALWLARIKRKSVRTDQFPPGGSATDILREISYFVGLKVELNIADWTTGAELERELVLPLGCSLLYSGRWDISGSKSRIAGFPREMLR